MKKFKVLVGVAGIMSLTTDIDTVHADTINVGASATIVSAALTLTKNNDLDFGTIIADQNSSCTVTIAASTATANPSVTAGSCSVSPGAFGSGRVSVGTNLDATVSINYTIVSSASPPVANQLYSSTATTTMPFLGTSISNNSTATNFAITAAGSNIINIGGVLTVGMNQAAGTYTGTITMTVNY